MSFALYFTIGLAITLLIGSIIIWKSDLPANDKLISLVVIMALFALVSIVNEIKRPQVIRSSTTKTTNFDKYFTRSL